MMTVQQVASNIGRLLGTEDLSGEETFFKQSVLEHIHGAFQELYTFAPGWMSRQSLTVNTTVGQAYIAMPSGFVGLMGPVSRSVTGSGSLEWELKPIKSREQWLSLINGNVYPGDVIYYFLDSTQITSAANSMQTRMLIYPTPATVYAITFDAKVGPPTFTVANLTDASAVNLPISHSYQESVFLPVARRRAIGDPLFENSQLIPQIKEDYALAYKIVDQANPEQVGNYAMGTPCGW